MCVCRERTSFCQKGQYLYKLTISNFSWSTPRRRRRREPVCSSGSISSSPLPAWMFLGSSQVKHRNKEIYTFDVLVGHYTNTAVRTYTFYYHYLIWFVICLILYLIHTYTNSYICIRKRRRSK